MQQERFEDLQRQIDEAEKNKLGKGEVVAPMPLVELSGDLSVLRVFLAEAVSKIEAGGKSRPRSLAITKLQEAAFWLMEEMRLS